MSDKARTGLSEAGSNQVIPARQLAHAGVELHDHVGGIEAALTFEVVGQVGELGAEPVKHG